MLFNNKKLYIKNLNSIIFFSCFSWDPTTADHKMENPKKLHSVFEPHPMLLKLGTQFNWNSITFYLIMKTQYQNITSLSFHFPKNQTAWAPRKYVYIYIYMKERKKERIPGKQTSSFYLIHIQSLQKIEFRLTEISFTKRAKEPNSKNLISGTSPFSQEPNNKRP